MNSTQEKAARSKTEILVSSPQEYIRKITTIRKCELPEMSFAECCWAFVGSFISIGAIAYLSFIQGIPILLASLGASACLIYGMPSAPLAQPRNAIAGHVLAAVIGVLVYQLAGCYWYTAGLSVGLAVAVMVGTRIVHPPAGATALIAVMTRQDWLFPLMPVGVGICLLVTIGIIVNNLAAKRQYPNYWW